MPGGAKGTYSGDGLVCAAGAVVYVVTGDAMPDQYGLHLPPPGFDVYRAAWEELERHVTPYYEDRPLFQFNDTHSKEEVLALFDMTIGRNEVSGTCLITCSTYWSRQKRFASLQWRSRVLLRPERSGMLSIGAVSQAMTGNPIPPGRRPDKRVFEVLEELKDGGHSAVASFNDTHSKKEVIGMFSAAIARLRG